MVKSYHYTEKNLINIPILLFEHFQEALDVFHILPQDD